MNRFKKSSGSKFQWRPAKPPANILNSSANATAAKATAATAPKTTATVTAATATANPFDTNQTPIAQELPQNLNTYLGPRGYTIPKSELSEQQLKDIRKTLTVRPVTGGAMFGAADTVEYPIYRESSNKIYLPRFYGKSMFGEVKRMAIHPGDDIAIEFAGGLRPIQVPVVEAYLIWINLAVLGVVVS